MPRRTVIFYAKRVLFVLIPVLFLLIFLEVAVRLSGVVERERYGLGNVGTAQWFTFRSNTLGFREEEIPLEKPSDEFRILCVGDSFAFGQGVERHRTFPRLLEKRWRKSPLINGKIVRVVNASKLGWNIAEEAGFVREQALQFNPDLIILASSPNDSEIGPTPDPFHNLWLPQSPLWHFHLLRFLYIRYLWISLEFLHPEDNTVVHLQRLWEAGSSNVDLYEKDFRAVARLARREGIPLLQVLFPFFYRLDDSYPLTIYSNQALQTAESVQVPCLDLLPFYLGRNPRYLRVSESDVHPNKHAHAIAANAIDPFVRNVLSSHASP